MAWDSDDRGESVLYVCIRAFASLSEVEDFADGGGSRNEGTDTVDDGEPGTATLGRWITVVLIGSRVFDRSWVGQGVYLSTRKMANRPISCRRGVMTIQSLLEINRIGEKLRGA